jgi:hypothetical protein
MAVALVWMILEQQLSQLQSRESDLQPLELLRVGSQSRYAILPASFNPSCTGL